MNSGQAGTPPAGSTFTLDLAPDEEGNPAKEDGFRNVEADCASTSGCPPCSTDFEWSWYGVGSGHVLYTRRPGGGWINQGNRGSNSNTLTEKCDTDGLYEFSIESTANPPVQAYYTSVLLECTCNP